MTIAEMLAAPGRYEVTDMGNLRAKEPATEVLVLLGGSVLSGGNPLSLPSNTIVLRKLD